MDLTPYVASVEDSLGAAAAAGDDETRRTATALTAALGPAMRLALMEALAELATEVGEVLGDRTVELRLDAGEVRVAVASSPTLEVEAPQEAHELEGEIARITLRLPESLKIQAEAAAARDGVSLNTWLTQAARASLGGARIATARRAGEPASHRLRGFVQA
jgi:hypothetical protein